MTIDYRDPKLLLFLLVAVCVGFVGWLYLMRGMLWVLKRIP